MVAEPRARSGRRAALLLGALVAAALVARRYALQLGSYAAVERTVAPQYLRAASFVQQTETTAGSAAEV